LAAAPTLIVACGISVVGGLGNGVQWVSVVSAIQEMTRSSMQARVMSVLESISAAMPGIGYLIGGLVAAGHNPRTTFLVAGTGVLVVTAIAARSVAGTPWTRGEGTFGPPDIDESAGRAMFQEDAGNALAHVAGVPDTGTNAEELREPRRP
jgi:MFS family permease